MPDSIEIDDCHLTLVADEDVPVGELWLVFPAFRGSAPRYSPYRPFGAPGVFLMIKAVLCWLGWHGPRDVLFHDGASEHARCRWCGYEGMIDSQGNLF